MLKVLFDATAVPADRGGVGRYIDSLLPALATLADAPELQVVCRPEDVWYYSDLTQREAIATPGWTGPRPARLLWEQTGLALLARRSGADVLHS
ncbi:MAG: hypothetical protein QOD87_1300, partial [Pseudonocardiales bacterium]|nr:hypothetical protein [Pseudonocardiales bacterium]